MDTAFVLITAGSAVIAVVMAAICWRIIREDRRRSTARVLALRAQLARSESEDADLRLSPPPASALPAATPAFAARGASSIKPEPRLFLNEFAATEPGAASTPDQQPMF